MLSIKPGVRVAGIRPEVVIAVVAAERVYEKAGLSLTVTACADGKHMAGSLHYAGAAIDIRTRDVGAAEKVRALADQIRECLGGAGGDYDVVVEGDHLHVEFQPKQPLA